jgi:arylformamidase
VSGSDPVDSRFARISRVRPRWPWSAGQVKVGLVNIDSIADGERPVHTVLLGAGIPIVEHMTGLAAVPDGTRFYAVPPPVEGMGTFPVRAFAIDS